MSEHADHHHDGEGRPSALMVELRDHIPFSVSAVAIGLCVAGIICLLGAESWKNAAAGATEHGHAHGASPATQFFHLFHPAHMLFSAAATSAMFCRYEHKVFKAAIIGLIGAVGVCGVSDIVLPHISLWMLDVKTPWHLCVVEHPDLVLPFAVIGVFIGIAAAGGVTRSTIFSHSLHVLVSTMASIFYMVGPLGVTAWIDELGKVFLFIVIAVMVPCCLSDIVFPMFMSGGARVSYEEDHHGHA